MSVYSDPDRPHLGGYIIGGDADTYYPDLWLWLVTELDVQTVLDIGCGEGQAVDYFDRTGCSVDGIDGIEQHHPAISVHDFTTGPFPWANDSRYDLGWSCEFVEHVREEHVPYFLDAFARCDVMLLTHGTPGQAGYHHVNLQESSYWIAQLASVGHVYDEELTLAARAIASRNEGEHNHFVRSGLAFRRKGRS